MALPKRFRFSDQKLLQSLLSSGKRRVSDSFTLVFDKNYNGQDLKVKVIIGKKIDKKATTRNKIRRKIQQAFEEIKKRDDSTKGNFLIFPRKKVILKDQKSLISELLNILSKEGFI